MNTRFFITAVSLLGASLVAAQNVLEDPASDPVLDAIQTFNDRDQENPNPPEISSGEPSESPERVETAPQSPEPTEPVIVTGAAPPAVETTGAPDPSPPETETVVTAPSEERTAPEDGLSVRIEKLHSGSGTLDPALVKLRAPFPAKPLTQAPAGWRLDASDSAPPFTREVELSPGSKITLSIRPHLLIPDSDGVNAFDIAEPGYEDSLGYQQASTVGAILANSIRQLDDDARQLSTAVDSLQQLLVSLPKPPAPPEPQPEPAQIAKPATNIRKK